VFIVGKSKKKTAKTQSGNNQKPFDFFNVWWLQQFSFLGEGEVSRPSEKGVVCLSAYVTVFANSKQTELNKSKPPTRELLFSSFFLSLSFFFF
jgi:hypothetical protein